MGGVSVEALRTQMGFYIGTLGCITLVTLKAAASEARRVADFCPLFLPRPGGTTTRVV